MDTQPTDPILLFDIDCLLCNRSVLWIARRETQARIHFAGLRSLTATELRRQYPSSAWADDTMLLLTQGKVLGKSDAVIAVARMLPFPWNLAVAARLIPRSVRDRLYDWIAANRRRWFGQAPDCSIMESSFRNRLLP